MSSNTSETTDPVAEANAIRERGAAHLAQLREEAAARRAEEARLAAAEDAKLAAAEHEFAAALAMKEREIQLAHARDLHAEAVDNHADASTLAARKYDTTIELADQLKEAMLDYLVSQRAADVAGQQLTDAANHRGRIEPTPDPRVGEPRAALIARNHPLVAIAGLAQHLSPKDPRWHGTRVVWP